MAKSKEELKALSEELESVSKKLAELTEEELDSVTGGIIMREGADKVMIGMKDLSGRLINRDNPDTRIIFKDNQDSFSIKKG